MYNCYIDNLLGCLVVRRNYGIGKSMWHGIGEDAEKLKPLPDFRPKC